MLIRLIVFIMLLFTGSLGRAQDKPVVRIDRLSTTSLLVEMLSNNQTIGSATAFVVMFKSKYYLISNVHVLSGRDPQSNKANRPDGRTPDELRVYYHHQSRLGAWMSRTEKLKNNEGTARWFEAQKPIDVAALPIENVGEIALYPFDLNLTETDMALSVGMPVSIIGFPGGITAAVQKPGLPVWKVGHIATDPDYDVQGLPVFLIDATTRPGMSGSPVVLRMYGAYASKTGQFLANTAGSTLFLGIYSAQQDKLELGLVWKPRVLTELLLRIP